MEGEGEDCKNIHAGPKGKQQGQPGGQGWERVGVSGHNQGPGRALKFSLSPKMEILGREKRRKSPFCPSQLSTNKEPRTCRSTHIGQALVLYTQHFISILLNP